ncbi:MBL fold metallo-hydrolase [Corynebacterium tapiri]|uniref:MBL fold metallo-hydrolase n=1 Tax=Corynebacterium tapiri TaxID=1448266 RepID=A0A5C4U826_9CORY|nr:MBL fold metallo-hydrolase [Corynebacterium tapiri]TNM00521.1 MBL fold metallo-hydrolase [Corynebacterium tapiri]
MKLTRRFHSCIEISQGTDTIVIDPGSFGPPENLSSVDAVLITHTHPDHIDADALAKACEDNPELQVYGPTDLSELTSVPFTTVSDGMTFAVGSISVRVVEHPHATVTSSKALPPNFGFIFDERIFHPGDAFPALPGMELTCVPVSAPWLRMTDVEDFLQANLPRTFVGVHDGIDNGNGRKLRRGLLQALADEYGVAYLPLEPDQAVEV